MIPGSLAQAIEQMVGSFIKMGKSGEQTSSGKGHGFLDLLSLRCQEDIQEVRSVTEFVTCLGCSKKSLGQKH